MDAMQELLTQWRRDFLDAQLANQRIRGQFSQQITKTLDEFGLIVDGFDRDLVVSSKRQLNFSQQLDAIRARTQYLEETSNQQSSEIQSAAKRINAIQSIADTTQAGGQTTQSKNLSGAPVDSKLTAALDAYYLAFENSHRGSEEAILEKFSAYGPELKELQALPGDLPVLDIGCGRGEWLSFVQKAGLSGRGIDLNPVMVAAAKEHGLTVETADLISTLKGAAEGSFKGITSFHVAEHLSFEVLFQAVGESWRALAPGGLLIMETPNPENILVGSHTFYHDHTHRNPLTPSSMEFLFRFWGFRNVRIKRLSPYPDSARVPGEDLLTERMNGLLCGPQDFAVIGQK
jgi:O-antigen chain-terminating methyltransferase